MIENRGPERKVDLGPEPCDLRSMSPKNKQIFPVTASVVEDVSPRSREREARAAVTIALDRCSCSRARSSEVGQPHRTSANENVAVVRASVILTTHVRAESRVGGVLRAGARQLAITKVQEVLPDIRRLAWI
jgi:hypothetical protein